MILSNVWLFSGSDGFHLYHCVSSVGPFLGNYRAFQGFGQAKFPDDGLTLGSNQFSILPQLPQKTMLGLKGVKID
jgi:hypothetical protein